MKLIASFIKNFKNVVLVDHLSVQGKTVYSVKDQYGNDAGHLMVWIDSAQLDVFVDNFPRQKRYFTTNLPIRNVDDFINDIERSGLQLMLADDDPGVVGTPPPNG